MSFRLTPEMAERPRRTIHAAEILHMNARTIAAACGDAGPDEIVVAVVDRNLVLAGVWTFPLVELTSRAPQADGGWLLTFSPGSARTEIEARCIDLARSALKRWEALRRWDSKHS
ncbi:MAG TPA: hypothetical protein VKX16_01725 [Chloroflexota bacterium]|nr:hypothetical protein [Chloroflexota bacterium]